MKKTSLTPKEIFRKRLDKNPIMKIDWHEQSYVFNKENEAKELKKNKKKDLKKNRETMDFGPSNPFYIPQRERVFTKCTMPKKKIAEPFIMSDVHTVCDITNSFFREVDGRPLRHRDDIKVYMTNIRDICLFKANAAYLKDQILQIDSAASFEREEYDKVFALVSQCKDAFIEFASMNYMYSKNYQDMAEEKRLELKKKTEELDIICEEFVKNRNKLADIIAVYENLARYRYFLDIINPIWWSAEHKEKIEATEDLFNMNSSNFTLNISFKSGGSFEINKENLERLLKVDTNPYFVDPSQLLEILEDMRRQCLGYLHRGVYSASILAVVLKGKDTLKAILDDDVRRLENYIDIYDSKIKYEEEQEESYKNMFFKILNHDFQELFASFDASKLFTCVQYASTKVFGEILEDPKDNIVTLMGGLEKHYMKLTSQLDALDVEVVKNAMNQAYSEDLMKIKMAHQAQRIMKESDILRRSMYASFEPPRYKKNKNVTEKKT